MTLTETERILDDRGMKSRRQALESSFWYRLSYHCCREFGPQGCTFHPAVDENSGSFMVTCKDSKDAPIFHTVIPRIKVQALLAGFKELLPNQNNMAIHPIPLKSIFKVSQNTELDLDVRPVIQLLQEEGESKFFEREDLERFRYGNLIYIKELGILAELERPGKEREFRAPVRMVVKKYQVPNFLEEVGEDLYNGQFLVDADVKGLRILKTFDRVEISPEAIDRDWCWLSVKYGFGNTAISLNDILSAKKEGQRFISIPEGWVDCQSPDLENFDALLDLAKSERFIRKSGRMKLSRTELFRLSAVSSKPLEIKGDKEHTDILKRLFEMKPSTPLPEIKGMRSTLRKYQKLGTQWLWYLFENGFGGLLCDDMGLGKTH